MHHIPLVKVGDRNYRLSANREILGNEKRLVFNIEHYICLHNHPVVAQLDPMTGKVKMLNYCHLDARGVFAVDWAEEWPLPGEPMSVWVNHLESMVHSCTCKIVSLRRRIEQNRTRLKQQHEMDEQHQHPEYQRKLKRVIWKSERRLLLEEGKLASYKLMQTEVREQFWPWTTNVPQWIFKQTETFRCTGGLQPKED